MKFRGACLFAVLAALYFLTYSGNEISTDELILYDGVHSFVQHGNFWLAYSNRLRPPFTYPGNVPVPTLDSEPGQIFAAAPLFLIAQVIPGLGLMQTVWLLNVITTALTGVLLFYYGVLLGYRERTAILVALLFGVATIAWPYSKVFFREPLFTLLALGCAYCLERWQQRRGAHRSLAWLALGGLLILAALITKEVAIFMLPTMVVIISPAARRLDKRTALISLAALVLVAALLLALSRIAGNGRFDFVARIGHAINEAEQAPTALAGYLISPGRSFLIYSPVLLLGIWGAYLLARAKRWRQLGVPLVTLASFALGYAFLQTVNWYGGTGWGPRYLLPVTPFLCLLLLPVIDVLPAAAWWKKAIAGVVILVSIGVQVIAVIVPVKAYYNFLAAESIRQNRLLVGWLDGTWNLDYIPASVVPRLLGHVPTDLAWDVNFAPGVALLCVGVMLLGAGGLLWSFWARNETRSVDSANGALLIVGAVLVLFGVGLRVAYTDPRYGGSDVSATQIVDTLSKEARPGDAVLLGSTAYTPYFMNYYKSRVPIFQLPDLPGEVDIPGKPPKVTSNNLDALVAPIVTMMLPRIGQFAPNWWYVTEIVPSDSSRTRATEHYLSRHNYPIREALSTNTARVIEFSAIDAPPDVVPPWPTHKIEAKFGPALSVVGYDIPASAKRGGVLPVSLLWRGEGWPDGSVPFDYSVNVSLVGPDGAVVPGAQRAGSPLGSFGQMSTWQQGAYYRDNHGLQVPVDIAPGDYKLWVLLYNWQDGSKVPITLDGQPAGDHLEIPIRIE